MSAKNIMYTSGGVPVKVNKKLGMGLIIAAFFFLFNPNIIIIDLLPDVIGYMLMCMGLSQLSLINPSFEEATAKFKKMIFVSLGKFVAFILLFSLFNERERPYGFLLFAFAFLVLDLIFLIPAVKELFEGFIYLAGIHKSEIAYKKRRERSRKTYIEKIYRLTVVFVIVKAALYTLPEFIVLVKDEYIDRSFLMYMYEYINVFRILSALIVLVLGIVWLLRTVRFFTKLSNESVFIGNLREVFIAKALPREGLFIKKAIKNALIWFSVGAILSLDLHVSMTLDNITSSSITISKITLNILPDFLSAACFLIAAIILKNYIKMSKKLIRASSVYASFSILASILKVHFLVVYGTYSAINHMDEAFDSFYLLCSSTIVENLAFVAMILMFAWFMKELIENYSGYVPSVADHTTEGLIKATHQELWRKMWFVIAFAVIGAIFASVYDFMLVERHLFAQVSWVIDFVAQALFAIVTIKSLFDINDEVESRYMLS